MELKGRLPAQPHWPCPVQSKQVGNAGLGGKVVHFIVQKEAGAAGDDLGAKAIVMV